MTKDLLTKEQEAKLIDNIGKRMKRMAKRLAPIDTGLLRAKTSYRVEGNDIILFSDVFYAEHLEFGTGRIEVGTAQSPRRLWNGTYLPFLRPAIYQVCTEMGLTLPEDFE
jgi:hypothetical protein